MRIGILTYHYVFNEGAVWQAQSFCRAVRKHYPQHLCEVVDYRHQGKYNALRRHISDEKQKLFDTALDDCLGDYLIVAGDVEELFKHLSDTYDLVIVGSDIIWQFEKTPSLWRRVSRGLERMGSLRPDRATPYHFLRDVKNWTVHLLSAITQPDPQKIPFPNAYWLDPVGEYKKSTFAASVGYSDVENIPAKQKLEMIRHLRVLDTVSVRDHASLHFVESLVPEKFESTRLTPDPTWLFDDPPMNVADIFDQHGLSGSDKFAGVLFPPHRYYGERLNRWVLPLLREKGFKIVSIIDANPDADVNLAGEALHPFAWWAVISRLDFFFTVRTHPSIAALKYETPFANVDITAMFNRSSHSKSRDMLETFGLEGCCLHKRSDFNRHSVTGLVERCLDRTWDWSAVARQRGVHRQVGLDALSAILGETSDG